MTNCVEGQKFAEFRNRGIPARHFQARLFPSRVHPIGHVADYAGIILGIIGVSVSAPLSSDLNVNFVCLSWTINLP